MSTTTENTIPTVPIKGDIVLNGRCVHFGDDSAAMPSAEEYAQGMKKLRATANCPVLSPEDMLLAAELSDIDLDIPNASQPESTLGKRRSEFERKAYLTFDELRADIAGLSWRLTMTSWIVAVAIIIAILMKLA